ncbi:MAG: hypothetical protein RR440_00420 [Erysipelotrichaceae bacterium]
MTKKLLTKKFKYENKPTYIKSIEASEIYEYEKKGTEMKKVDYVGMIPFSLELIKLREEGLVEFKEKIEAKKDENGKFILNVEGKKIYETEYVEMDKRQRKVTNRFLTDDIINVKFKTVVNDAEEIINRKTKYHEDEVKIIMNSSTLSDIEKAHQLKVLKDKYNTFVDEINALKDGSEDGDVWKRKVSLELLRKNLYEDGFTLYNFKGEPIKYVRYKRSSAKSRTGECLFISEALYEVMIKWSRMNLDIKEGQPINLAGLLSYESLVGSTITDLIQIPVENILLINDVDSVFKKKVNVIEKSANPLGGGLVSIEDDDYEITNSLWDGQSLLSSKYYPEGKGMMIIRNTFFKSCTFSTNIQKFMDKHKPKEIESLDDWILTDMFDNPIPASQVELITTPNSLKALQFSELVGTGNDMYNHWKDVISIYKGGSYFGVVKHEKETKRGFIEVDGEMKPLQRLSYQMINSLPMSKKEIIELCQFEMDYIMKMKNDEDNLTYIEYLERTSTQSNTNALYAGLYKYNKKFGATKLFKDYKKKKIYSYVDEVKKGKVRLVGADYCTIAGNIFEMLLASVKQFDIDETENHSLKGNEVYTPLFKNGDKLTAFRNPHTSISNTLFLKNVNKEKGVFETYFNLTNNIIVANTIEFELPDIASGSDFDGDTLYVTSSPVLNTIRPKKDEEFKYRVCVNKIPTEKIKYVYSEENCFKVDKSLANSYVGMVVNLGQQAQAIYFDALKTERENYEVIAKDMKEVINIVSILSTVAIDMAKRKYDVELSMEIGALAKRVNKYKKVIKEKDENGEEKEVKVDPQFFKLIKKRKNKKKKIQEQILIDTYKKISKLDKIEVDDETLKEYEQLKAELIKVVEEVEPLEETEVDVEEEFEEFDFEIEEEVIEEEREEEVKIPYYDTPMDYLVEFFSKIEDADPVSTIEISSLIQRLDTDGKQFKIADADDKQENEIIQFANSAIEKVKSLQAHKEYKQNKEEFYVIINNEISDLGKRLGKRKIDAVTMYSILYHMFDKKVIKQDGYLLNELYKAHEQIFLNGFLKGE